MSYIARPERRWFEDQHPSFRGRLLELYAVADDDVMASVCWRDGRPGGTRRSWYGRLSTLIGERLTRNRGGGLRYRELEGDALARVRRGDLRREADVRRAVRVEL